MRTLLTGATGFIGRHLLRTLQERGHEVTIAYRGADPVERTDSTSSIRAVLVGDIDGTTDWRDALRGNEVVIHLAGLAHRFDSPEDDLFAVNADGTSNLAAHSAEQGIRHFVYMSSIGAVATSSDTVLTTETEPRPSTAYGRSKLEAENRLREVAGGSMTWTIIRPTLVYGPGNPGNMASLVHIVRAGVPLPLGSIDNRRSFTYVQNLVDFTEVAATHPAARDSVFLISDNSDMSIAELLSRLADCLGRPARVFPMPMSLLRIAARSSDFATTLIRRRLPFGSTQLDQLSSSLFVDPSACFATGWRPRYATDEGLRLSFSPTVKR